MVKITHGKGLDHGEAGHGDIVGREQILSLLGNFLA
jgi:hypothetical protein